MFRNNLVYRFATKAYDLAVIGGGPGGKNIHLYRLCCCYQSCSVGLEHRLYRKKRKSWRNMPQYWMHSFQSFTQHLA